MKLREIPVYPQLFVDFVENSWSGEPLLSAPPTMDSVVARGHLIRQGRIFPAELARMLVDQAEEFGAGTPAMNNIRRLAENEAVAVVASLRSGLFGGPLSVLLKSLSAIRLAAELRDRGLSAVPVVWIRSLAVAGDPAALSINLLDSESRLKKFSLDGGPDHSTNPRLPVQVESFLEEIAQIAQGVEVDEMLQILKSAYAPGTHISTGMGRFLSTLLKDWGPVVIDCAQDGFRAFSEQYLSRLAESSERFGAETRERYNRLEQSGYVSFPMPEPGDEALLLPLLQESMLPVAAHVTDAAELPWFTLSLSLFRAAGMPEPLLWPRTGATILDRRSRKLLEKYRLRLEDLLSGGDPAKVVAFYEETGRRAVRQFDSMSRELDDRMAELAALVCSETEIRSFVDGTHERLKYQIVRLKDRFVAGAQARREVVGRQVERVCASVAPEGRLQEDGLAGLQVLLRYSASILEILYEKLDITRFEHQTIAVD